jgi:excisionase family DNA binding protein
MCNGQRDALYSNRTATGMMSIPNDYHREAMRSAMHFAAESKHVRWKMYTLQGKVYPLRNPQEGTPQRLLLRIPEVAETPGIGRTKIYELIATGVLPTIRVGRAVRITNIALQKWVEARELQDVPCYGYLDYLFRKVVLRRLHW